MISNSIFVDGVDMTNSITNSLLATNYNINIVAEDYGIAPSKLYSFLSGNDVVIEREDNWYA